MSLIFFFPFRSGSLRRRRGLKESNLPNKQQTTSKQQSQESGIPQKLDTRLDATKHGLGAV